MTGNTSCVDDRATPERLLDAAERLFGESGFDGVGMRALAAAARVNLGAVAYHFGSKKQLYIQAFMRRIRPVNAQRLRLLEEAKTQASANGKPLGVGKIIECMIAPIYLHGSGQSGFNAFLARNALMPPPFLDAVLRREWEPGMSAFGAALQRALPGIRSELIGLRSAFAMSALLLFVTRLRETLPALGPDFDRHILDELVRFIVGGLSAEPAHSAAEWARFAAPPGLAQSGPARVRRAARKPS